jgi:hypothetical protein
LVSWLKASVSPMIGSGGAGSMCAKGDCIGDDVLLCFCLWLELRMDYARIG